MWAKFDSLEQFNEWHKQIKIQLDIPKLDGISTEYARPYIKEDGTVVTFVEDENSQGLIETEPYKVPRLWEN